MTGHFRKFPATRLRSFSWIEIFQRFSSTESIQLTLLKVKLVTVGFYRPCAVLQIMLRKMNAKKERLRIYYDVLLIVRTELFEFGKSETFFQTRKITNQITAFIFSLFTILENGMMLSLTIDCLSRLGFQKTHVSGHTVRLSLLTFDH